MGHNPLSIRKRDDFPHPFGPVIRRWFPGEIVKVKLGTTTSPFGVTIGTFNKLMLPSVLFSTVPIKKNNLIIN